MAFGKGGGGGQKYSGMLQHTIEGRVRARNLVSYATKPQVRHEEYGVGGEGVVWCRYPL